MNMKKNLLEKIVFPALALAALCGCEKKNAQTTAELPAEVVVSAPLVADVEIVNSYSARISAREDVEIRARVGGYLDKIAFEKGARVRKGDVLFKIDPRPYEAALSAAEAAVKAAQSQIPLARDNAERARGLFGRNAISKEVYQTRETQLLVAQAKLLEAKAAENNARLNLEYATVVAPVSGRIGENFVDAGNLVSSAMRLARIVDDSVAKVYFELNSADAMRYKNSGLLKQIDAKNGAKVSVKANGDNREYSGKLSYYDNALGRGTASLVVSADIDNPDGGLMAGSFGEIRVLEGIKKDALLVPEEAIGTDMVGRYVLVVGDGDTIKQVPVKLGKTIKNLSIIESGLDKNSRVVVKGIQRAAVGRKVAPIDGKIEKLSELK